MSSEAGRLRIGFVAASTLLGVMVVLGSCAKKPPTTSNEESQPADSPPITGTVPTDETPEEPVGPPDPNFVGGEASGEKNFAVLINHYQQAKLSPTPWAGYWWPYKENGVAKGTGGGSPAGKYDAARGHKTRAQDWEVRNHGSAVPRVASWWGHCNGWTAAATLFPEPRESVTYNGIRFTVSDIKALLSEAAMEVDADFFGNRVDWYNAATEKKAWDVAPNQYFLVLTNYIGKLNIPVAIDRYTMDQVWNQPLVAYRFEYPKPSDYLGNTPEAPNVYRINVTSTIYWANDGVPPDVQTPPFNWSADGYLFDSRSLNMELWLDGPVVFGADGKIQSSGGLIAAREGEVVVGGAWKNGAFLHSDMHPDYMWVPHEVIYTGEVERPDDPYANPHVDISWIRKHLIERQPPEPGESPGPIDPVPHPSPTSTWTPGPRPTPRPTPVPVPVPVPNPTVVPQPTPVPVPVPAPTSPPPGPGPVPDPNPTSTRSG